MISHAHPMPHYNGGNRGSLHLRNERASLHPGVLRPNVPLSNHPLADSHDARRLAGFAQRLLKFRVIQARHMSGGRGKLAQYAWIRLHQSHSGDGGDWGM
jgi:hypothetical protein